MYNVTFKSNFYADLWEITDYIFRFSFNYSSTNKVYDEIMWKILWLKIFPNMYPVFEWDLRVMTVRNKYKIFYKVDEISKIVTIYYIFGSEENYEELIH